MSRWIGVLCAIALGVATQAALAASPAGTIQIAGVTTGGNNRPAPFTGMAWSVDRAPDDGSLEFGNLTIDGPINQTQAQLVRLAATGEKAASAQIRVFVSHSDSPLVSYCLQGVRVVAVSVGGGRRGAPGDVPTTGMTQTVELTYDKLVLGDLKYFFGWDLVANMATGGHGC